MIFHYLLPILFFFINFFPIFQLLIVEIVESCRDKAAEAQEGLNPQMDLSILLDDDF